MRMLDTAMRRLLHLFLATLGHRAIWLARKIEPTGRGRREDLAEQRVKVWYADRDHVTKLVDFPIDEDAIVFDVGGYRGDWAIEILSRYNCRVEVFEPVPDFYDQIRRRLAFSDRVNVHEFGLGGASRTLPIALSADGSSAFHAFARNTQTIGVEIRDLVTYLDAQGLDRVDLLKLNIEGAEYELLERVLDTGRASTFKHILVQFHDQIPGAAARAAAISDRLSETHELVWRVPFVWEAWMLRATAGEPGKSDSALPPSPRRARRRRSARTTRRGSRSSTGT
jgi:FkbM family methyltransferase